MKKFDDEKIFFEKIAAMSTSTNFSACIYKGLCLCYDSECKGRSTPTTAFDRLI